MSPIVSIRRADPPDAPAIAALTRRAYAKWVPVIGREPMPMTADYDRAVVEHVIDLAEIGGALAALVEMAIEPDHLLIVNLAVDPAEQGQGLGSRLLAHAEKVAGERRLSTLRLYTNSLMAENIALYRRRGYEIERVEVRSPVWSAVHMLKRLPTGGARLAADPASR